MGAVLVLPTVHRISTILFKKNSTGFERRKDDSKYQSIVFDGKMCDPGYLNSCNVGYREGKSFLWNFFLVDFLEAM